MGNVLFLWFVSQKYLSANEVHQYSRRRVDSRENYWLRTPAKNKKEAIWYINGTGKANAHDNYDDVSYGIRPAMWVSEEILSEVTLFRWYGGTIL